MQLSVAPHGLRDGKKTSELFMVMGDGVAPYRVPQLCWK